MSILKSVTTGKTLGAQIHTVFGNNGVGKTTFASGFPNVLILDLEKGSEHLEVARVTADQIPDLAAFRAVLKELNSSDHNYKTLAIDSVESLEGLISDAVLVQGNVDSIEKYDGGYGKGYTRIREIMREVMLDLRALQARDITTILIAHTQTKPHSDPATNQTYDRIVMRANDKMAALIRDLSDNVFFATYKVFTTESKGKTHAFGDGQRVMYTQWRPGYDAKNRLDLPHEIPLSYEAFVEACEKRPEADPKALIEEIRIMSEKVDPQIKKVVAEQIERFKVNPAKLQEVKTRLMKHVNA